MPFDIREIPKRKDTVYKSIYLDQEYVNRINALAEAHGSSFNAIVVSMVVSCLNDIDKNSETTAGE